MPAVEGTHVTVSEAGTGGMAAEVAASLSSTRASQQLQDKARAEALGKVCRDLLEL